MRARRLRTPAGEEVEVSGSDPAVEGQRAIAGDLRLLVPACAAWALLAVTLSRPGVALPVAALALVLAALSAWRQRRMAALALAVVALLQCALLGHHLVRSSGQLGDLSAERAVVTLEGTVSTEPLEIMGGRGDSSAVLVRLRARHVEGRGLVGPARAPVLLRGGPALRELRWHSQVRVTGKLAPGDAGRAEFAVLSVRGPVRMTAPPGPVARGTEHLRAGLRRSVEHAPADARGLLPGLVIGDTSRTPPELTEAMRATGLTHLTAVSGSNVAIVVGLVLALSGIVGVPRRLRPWLALLALVGFVMLARPEPSVIRAGTMGAIALLGMSRSRRAAGLPVLAGAVVAVLVVDPWMARSYGFALSTLATMGLLLFTRPWGDAIAARLPARLRLLGPAVAIPVAAQAMCAPVIVLLQGSVSIIGVLANLLAAPLVAPATIAGVLAALTALVSDHLSALVGWAGALPTMGIATVAHRLADVPGGTMPWPDGAPGALLLAALTVAVLLAGPRLFWVSRTHPTRTLAVVGVVAALLIPVRTVTWPPPGWQVVFCDVGQGDAAVLRTGPSSAVLVDAGPDPPSVNRCLDRLGVRVLDAVVLTHFHADHVDGLPGAMAGRVVRQVLTTPIREPTFQATRVEGWTRARGIPVSSLAAGDRIQLGRLEAAVWAPSRRIASGSVPNNSSVVLSARVGVVHVLLLGDVEREAGHDILLRLRRDVVMSAASEEFDAVKTPHHGSANLDEGLMEQVRAPVAVVSVGKDNDYGHPAPTHLNLLRRFGYAVYRTDQRGDVALVERRGVVSVVSMR